MIIALALSALLVGQPAMLTGVVRDITGSPLAGAVVQVSSGTASAETRTATDGSWSVSLGTLAAPLVVRVTARGFAPLERLVQAPGAPIVMELQPQGISERTTVFGTAGSRLAIESSATTLSGVSMAAAPALALDDQLRSVPGFSLFRRTSSRVANPTTQGVTLRGLSASGASRTLVLADEVPLNDPFGGWVYWNRVPAAAIDRVDVVRGSSGDIHGDDALGGVIRIHTRTSPGAELRLDGGGQKTARGSGYAGAGRDRWNAGGAAEIFTTGGYRVVAPEERGPVDVAADSESQAGMAWLGVTRESADGTLRGGYLHERRGNGTRAQVNATISRWVGAAARGLSGGGVWEARGDFGLTNYRQTFSAVAANRASERLTNLQWVGSRSGGGAFSWVRSAGRTTSLISASARIATATLDEAGVSAAGVTGALSRTPARQRREGLVFQERIQVTPRISLEAGARGERWRTHTSTGLDDPAARFFLEPRVGASFSLGEHQSLRVAWLSGFRTPTINELYRSFRVGNTVTQSNPSLLPEESWGPEIALTAHRDRWAGRAVFFATHLDAAVYNRTLSSSPTLIQRIRSNGGARAVGSELEVEGRVFRRLSATSSWALTDSSFTGGELSGKRVPQVPRVQGAVGLRVDTRRFTTALDLRVVGAQFDDDVNAFRLGAGALADCRVGWRLSRQVEVFGAVENAFDEELDAGRTPIRTIGSPRVARVGLLLRNR